jgi:hypothetical protein
MTQHLLQMKAGNSEHERGLILEPNRTPDEMYMATQPSNRQNLSRCLQETSCRRPPAPPPHGRGPASPVAQPSLVRQERKGKGGGAPIRRRRRRSAVGGMPRPPPVSRRYGPGKGEDWLIARAVGFIVLSRSCSGSGGRE